VGTPVAVRSAFNYGARADYLAGGRRFSLASGVDDGIFNLLQKGRVSPLWVDSPLTRLGVAGLPKE